MAKLSKKGLKITSGIFIFIGMLVGANVIPGVLKDPVLATIWGVACVGVWFGVNKLFGKNRE